MHTEGTKSFIKGTFVHQNEILHIAHQTPTSRYESSARASGVRFSIFHTSFQQEFGSSKLANLSHHRLSHIHTYLYSLRLILSTPRLLIVQGAAFVRPVIKVDTSEATQVDEFGSYIIQTIIGTVAEGETHHRIGRARTTGNLHQFIVHLT